MESNNTTNSAEGRTVNPSIAERNEGEHPRDHRTNEVIDLIGDLLGHTRGRQTRLHILMDALRKLEGMKTALVKSCQEVEELKRHLASVQVQPAPMLHDPIATGYPVPVYYPQMVFNNYMPPFGTPQQLPLMNQMQNAPPAFSGSSFGTPQQLPMMNHQLPNTPRAPYNPIPTSTVTSLAQSSPSLQTLVQMNLDPLQEILDSATAAAAANHSEQHPAPLNPGFVSSPAAPITPVRSVSRGVDVKPSGLKRALGPAPSVPQPPLKVTREVTIDERQINLCPVKREPQDS